MLYTISIHSTVHTPSTVQVINVCYSFLFTPSHTCKARISESFLIARIAFISNAIVVVVVFSALRARCVALLFLSFVAVFVHRLKSFKIYIYSYL